uniref:IgGFc_binding domain-containing protein n=1 Tax=Rhabditophanes sp. KR3021 TaxID=114890 RepID=A0AC35TY13_9BILA
MNVQFVNINGGGGSINLDCKYFLFNNYNGMNQLYTIPDNRIIITSDNPIKVLVQVNFGNFNGQTIGDMYLVYPDFLLGNKYKVKLPKSSNGTPGLISLMALDNGPPIRGFITQYKNGSIASVNQFILAGAVGERQAIFVSDSSDQDISYTIVANREFVVVANVPCVDLSFASGNAASDSTSACDYSAFTLLPIQNYDCHSYLDGNGDIKGISSQFTNYIYELPNAVECSSNLLVFNNLKYRVTTEDKVSVNMGKSISINSKSSDGFSSRSTYTKIRTTRLGGSGTGWPGSKF